MEGEMMMQESSHMISSFLPPTGNYLPFSGQSFYFKSRMCTRFSLGRCPNGDRCNFAHSVGELRKPPSGAEGDCLPPEIFSNRYVQFNQFEGKFLNKNKVNRKFYLEGICPYDRSRQNSVVWKTKLCRRWSNYGRCPYGDQCNHAHGDAELRKIAMGHSEEDVKSSAAIQGKVSRSDNILLRRPKPPQPSSLPPPATRMTALTLGKCKHVYGDWIDA